MIDEKKIEEAAIEASIEDTAKGRNREHYVINALADHENGFQEGFEAGINWFKENLWHDANEEPIGDGDILAQCGDKELKFTDTITAYGRKHSKWCTIVGDRYVIRWLYIDDLMKGGE